MRLLLVFIFIVGFKFCFSQSSVLVYSFSTEPNSCIFDINQSNTLKAKSIYRFYADSTYIINIFTNEVTMKGNSCWGGFRYNQGYEEKGTWKRDGKYIRLRNPRDGKSFGRHRYIETYGFGGTLNTLFSDLKIALYSLNQDCITKINELDKLKNKIPIQ